MQRISEELATDISEQLVEFRHVEIDHGVTHRTIESVKQLRFRLEIRFHRAVEIEVVPGQIGENSNAEIDIVNAIQHQGVRRDFNDRVHAKILAHQKQQPLHIKRLRGSPFRLEFLFAGVIEQRGYQPYRLAARFENLFDQIAGCGLTVGAGHAAHFNAEPRITVEFRRDLRHRRPRAWHLNVGFRFRCAVPLANHRHRPA